ncbi:hypothetical protein [Pelagibacterium sp.]|uniref:hypothetical protein n=1 Tax=Pelagibacterium sp. TaxID=1967288 RepID=UPI003BA90880
MLSSNTTALADRASDKPVRRESADDYHRVIIRLNVDWRVIECRDGIQWILQRRQSSETIAKPDWRGVSYCRTREALIRCLANKGCGDITPDAHANLMALPAMIGGAA